MAKLDHVSHDYIRYANCWEDADILLQGLRIEPEDRVLSIGSAGDNSFSLLAENPKLVVAVDVNFPQLHLIELKKAAFKTLNYQEFLQFLGFSPSNYRLEFYHHLKNELPEKAKIFWDKNQGIIADGVIYSGKFERYFRLFRKRILPLIHSKQTIRQLFEEKQAEEQQLFFNNIWNNWRWRLLFRLFFSRFILGRFGRDPAFLNEVNVPVPNSIANRANEHLSSILCQKNYFLQFILTGKFISDLPHYAREEHFQLIKANINRLQTVQGYIQDAFDGSTFNKFNCSNIFEYMDSETFQIVANKLEAASDKNARFAYWNLLVPRKLADATPLTHQLDLSERLSRMDKGFFYGGFFVDVN